MERYNYYEAVRDDVLDHIRANYTAEEARERLESRASRERWEEELNDSLWINDGITGNASGSYTFNTWRAEEYIAHNLDLLREAVEEFGGNFGEAVERGAEYCDVTIRCYLLYGAIGEALDEIEREQEDGEQ